MFTYRNSVESYLSDTAVRHATDLLLAETIAYMPEQLDDGDVSKFYQAWLAARRVQVELVQDLRDLCRLIWTPLPRPWIALPHDPADAELSLDPIKRWKDTKNFQQAYVSKDRATRVDFWVEIKALSIIEIGFSFGKGEEYLLNKDNYASYLSKNWVELDDSLYCNLDVHQSGDGLDLEALKRAAGEARDAIDLLMTQS